MLNIPDHHSDNCEFDTRFGPIRFFTNLFRKKKSSDDSSSELDKRTHPVRASSTLSVRDVLVTTYPVSPALSTPARTRDIDSDMETLRISRQDNPFIKQVLASRESLADSLEESESDNTNLMSQEYLSEAGTDPMSLPEVHEHMIRSPPPTSWPRSPNYKMFRFSDDGSHLELDGCSSLSRSSYRQEVRIDPVQDRNFTLLAPAPLRSLEVRRLASNSDEDSQRLVSSDVRP
ncbi:Hypothetical protein NTJ_12276 [Nesidiocoris tenuis]|uniref:Uncharacterized protein n=1 Tax=Nesidiocoris tenuis TaxID=355587 RepID=A0ABN7B4Y4_9HEMI|nr:Hypothetical protein NTJ_12276 [Nesidiocoris tenuis]